ncbi:MAG: glycosyltransferase [Ghiorsea sp.]
MPKKTSIEISILVTSRDRRDLLACVLHDLQKQVCDVEFEVVVVEETDAPSSPEGVVYVPHPVKNLGIAYARNMSVKYASYDILVFIDDDCRVDSTWLKQLIAPLDDASVLGVQGGVALPRHTNAIGWAESLLGFPGGGVTRVYEAAGNMQETVEVSTLNACYRKSSLLEAGGFSREARFGGEDYLLAKRVAKKGKLLFVPDAKVRHAARGSLKLIWPWFVRRGRAEFDLYRSGVAPMGYLSWMLRSSISLKLLPFAILALWSFVPFYAALIVIFGINWWRFRWVLDDVKIPSASWLVLPLVRLTMNIATDIGRIKAWLNAG